MHHNSLGCKQNHCPTQLSMEHMYISYTCIYITVHVYMFLNER